MYEEENDLIQNEEPEQYYDELEPIDIQQDEMDFAEPYEEPYEDNQIYEDNQSYGSYSNYNIPQSQDAPQENIVDKTIETAGDTVETAGEVVENAGKAVETAGKAVETTGAAVETTGKAVETTGEVAEKAGMGMKAAGVALDAAGKGISAAGAGLDSTGVGAVVGVGLNVIGTGIGAVGTGAKTAGEVTEKAGTATKTAGTAINKTGKNIKKQGRNIKKKGTDIKKKGSDIKKKGTDLKNNAFNKKQQYQHKKNGPGLSNLKGKTNISLGGGKLKINLPIKFKIILIVILISISILFLLLFVVLFASQDLAGGNGGSGGTFKYGATCTTVTVTDSGCDANAKNCTNKYDGDVSFEDYIAGVVAAEVGGGNNLEFYKAAAVAARTYFLSHTSEDNCTIKGNSSAQAYMSIDSSSKADLIKQAVNETKGLVLIKNGELMSGNYSSACVVNADDNYYYIRYGTSSIGTANFQNVPKEWDSDNSHAYSGNLASWYSKVDKNNNNYKQRKCPGNHDYGMSQIGALYLAIGENYSYDEILKYYYGNDAEIVENTMTLNGAEGFVNPTRKIHCSSAYGYRIHPVKNVRKLHTGLDIGIAGGEPIYASKDGIITNVVKTVKGINDCNYGYGNYIRIDHGDGTTTLYAHIRYGTIPDSITEGASVSQGEQIGQVGSTGCSTGNHLHYEIKVNGSTVDPADYLNLNGATGSCKR